MNDRTNPEADEKEVTPADVEGHRYTNPGAEAEKGENEDATEDPDVEGHRLVNPRVVNPRIVNP